MAIRDSIISVTCLLALGTACSKAPSYNTGVDSGATEAASADVVTDTETDIGHGLPNPEAKPVTADVKKEEPAAAPTAPAPTPAAKPAPVALTPEQKAKKIATDGFVAYAVNAPTGAGWNTVDTPYLIGQTVTAAGAVDTAKPVTVYFCNFSAGQMRLHSASGAGPTPHGAAFAGVAAAAVVPPANLPAMQAELDKKTLAEIQAMPNCGAHQVTALGTTTGATYNHNGGNPGNAASFVYFKMYTVDPAGVVTAR